MIWPLILSWIIRETESGIEIQDSDDEDNGDDADDIGVVDGCGVSDMLLIMMVLTRVSNNLCWSANCILIAWRTILSITAKDFIHIKRKTMKYI